MNPFSMAQSWRKPVCAVIELRLRKKANGGFSAIKLFPMAAQWRKRRRKCLFESQKEDNRQGKKKGKILGACRDP
jgi:hypothetical protein